MTLATYQVQVAWDGVTFGGTASDDITSYVVEITTTSGREHAGYLTGKAAAGTCDIILRNTDGSFSPLYGAYLGAASTTTALPLRVRTTSPSTTVLWQGFVDDIAPEASLQGIPMARITGLGPLSEIAAKTATCNPSSSGSLTSDLVTVILDAIGWSATDRTISTGTVLTGFWLCDGSGALDALRLLEDTELGFLYESSDGKVVFEHRYYRDETPRSNTSQATFSDAAASTLSYRGIRMSSRSTMRRDQFDHVTIGVTPSKLITESQILWDGSVVNGLLPVVPPGETKTVTAQWSGSLLAIGPRNIFQGVLQVGHPYVWSWDRVDLVAGVGSGRGSDPGGEATPDDLTLTITERKSQTITFTITNNGADPSDHYAVYIYGKPALLGDPIQITAGTGFRDYPFPGNWYKDQDQATAAAQWILDHFALPRATFSLDLLANKNSSMMTQCLTRVISDRVTVTATGTRTRLGTTGIPCYIEQVRHHITQNGGIHETTWDLSAVDTIVPRTVSYARWDVGKWDVDLWTP